MWASLEGEFYAYVVNHVGAAWSAYWWARLSALLLRLTHMLVRYKHLGAVYVDGFSCLCCRAFAFLVVHVLAILQILCVLLSWKTGPRKSSYIRWLALDSLLGLLGFVA